MRIGIDLDNTIIRYDKAFLQEARRENIVPHQWVGGKKKIQEFILETDPKGLIWQRLQGRVYGKHIKNADVFPGVHRFLWRCHSRDIQVHVVSHKTQFGHFDTDETPLRDVAVEFLKDKGLYSNSPRSLIKSVTFKSTLSEKVEHIRRENFSWFVDDLLKVFQYPRFPDTVKKILFSPSESSQERGRLTCQSWGEIENCIFGEWNERELISLGQRCRDGSVLTGKWLGGRGNSGVALIEYSDKQLAILKIYSDDEQHDRLFSEFNGFNACHQVGITQVPKPIGMDRRLSIGLFEYISGSSVVDNVTTNDISQAFDLLSALYKGRNEIQFKKFPNASAACLSGAAVNEQIELRLRSFAQARTEFRVLEKYLQREFIPLYREHAAKAKQKWACAHGFDDALPDVERTLSPSDFGFHNVVRRPNKEIIFIDFEYFGWDDPAKLVADFLLHPGMELSKEIQKMWVEGTVTIYGSTIIPRLVALWPLFGLCWCLILLNEFRRDGWVRRKRAVRIEEVDRDKVLAAQINKSRKLLSIIDDSSGIFLS